MDRDIIIGLLSALPGIIALILYIIDSYKDRYKLSIIKRKENLIVQSQSIGKEEFFDGNIKTNEDLSDYLQTESNKFFANFEIIISNLGRRPITINKIKVKISDYEESIKLKKLILLKAGESEKKKFNLYLGKANDTKKFLKSDLVLTITDHRNKQFKINLRKITI